MVIRGAEFGTKSLAEVDIARIAKTNTINEVARKTNGPRIFIECEIVNQSEAMIITEAGPKSPGATNSRGENPKLMTNILGEEMNVTTTIYAREIGSLRETTSAHDEETSEVTNINEGVFVKSTKMKCSGPAADVIFPGVNLRQETKDIGRGVVTETLEKFNLEIVTEGALIFPGKTYQTSRFFKHMSSSRRICRVNAFNWQNHGHIANKD